MLIGNIGAELDLTPAQSKRLAEEKRKWAQMNETRTAAGLAPLPIPSDAELVGGDVQFVKVGRSKLVRTTRAGMSARVAKLKAQQARKPWLLIGGIGAGGVVLYLLTRRKRNPYRRRRR